MKFQKLNPKIQGPKFKIPGDLKKIKQVQYTILISFADSTIYNYFRMVVSQEFGNWNFEIGISPGYSNNKSSDFLLKIGINQPPRRPKRISRRCALSGRITSYK